MKKIVGFFIAFALLITLLPLQKTEAAAVNKHYTVEVDMILTVREKPSPKAKIAGSLYLKKGEFVFVYTTEPGGWSKVKYDNKAGYVVSSYLIKKGTNNISIGHATVTASPTLNVREKATPKAKVIGSLKKDATVFVYNTEPGGWSKIKYNGKVGYVASNYLKIKSNGIISRTHAREILVKHIKLNTTYQGLSADPEMDQIINGIKFYFFDKHSIREDMLFAAESYFVSSKDGLVLRWDNLEQIR